MDFGRAYRHQTGLQREQVYKAASKDLVRLDSALKWLVKYRSRGILDPF
jgi:hypothetical protein